MSGERAERPSGRVARALARAAPLAGAALFVLALWTLREALAGSGYDALREALAELPAASVAAALLATVAGYSVLPGYDALALRWVGARVPRRDVAAAAVLSGALGNNLGNTLLAGGAVRYWVYTAAGLGAGQVLRVVLACSASFWLGCAALAAVAFLAMPEAAATSLLPDGVGARLVGALSLALPAAWIVGCARGGSLRIGERRIALPPVRIGLAQPLVGACDLGLMAAALWVLLPQTVTVAPASFVAAFLVATVAGAASQVPGGLGVFEAAMVALLPRQPDPTALVAALLAFRAVYLLLPLLLAALAVGASGAWRRIAARRSAAASAPPAAPAASRVPPSPAFSSRAPTVLAAATFACGAVLLLSGALPAAVGRLEIVRRLLSLPVVEASHFAASLVGAALLVVAVGLQRRLDAAWLLAVTLLGTGAVLSLAKGLDYEEAAVLGLVMLATLPMRERFHRTSSLLWAPFEPPWIAACAVVLGGSAWLTRYAHRHAGVADEAWWRFALSSEGPRSLRALVGAVALLVLLALYRLIRPMPARVLPPTPDDLERARPIVERSAWTYPNLVYRRDKAVLFGAAGDAFLMYGRQGRSWIAMGDPIGPAGSVAELAWRLRDLADRADGRCVFFEVHDAHRALYADLGLTLTRFGDEARIPLDGFDLASPTRRGLRQARSRLLHAGHRFEILPADAVPALLPELRAVSDAWLAGKRTHEKGFSNASFDPAYLGRFPIALVRDAARVVAFANVWYGADREELSIDLMRHRPGAPNGTMDFLFAELLSHGHALGYRWFNLGVAPLAGLDARQGPSVWRRVGAFVYRHGEHFYNFDGLRRYKEKFAPAWTPVYVASPGGLALAPVLVDVAALIAGGLGGIVSRRAGRRGDAA